MIESTHWHPCSAGYSECSEYGPWRSPQAIFRSWQGQGPASGGGTSRVRTANEARVKKVLATTLANGRSQYSSGPSVQGNRYHLRPDEYSHSSRQRKVGMILTLTRHGEAGGGRQKKKKNGTGLYVLGIVGAYDGIRSNTNGMNRGNKEI
ncbi:hypothetical protein MPH_09032 [Macrophomina phaseolina MS6]|uniref:Uncharacterized protein n=1 Tax=Macrophomina phaseolina (strain MS6) TaxID=1126212 RepID=K2RUB1_MACPH|nr:hypothetical protein MPH_09032 [Macrophomina phaseolina MS6]